MILPRLSLVWDLGDTLMFFIQVPPDAPYQDDIRYASAQKMGDDEWKIEMITS